jgi:succinate-semialdehyde dehydrogenase/glutarate-semialdehyde dehydrogenase
MVNLWANVLVGSICSPAIGKSGQFIGTQLLTGVGSIVVYLGNKMKSVDPASGRVFAEYETYSADEVERRVKLAVSAFGPWSAMMFSERAALVSGLADKLRGRKSELARLITSEMGKPLGQSEAEIEKCAWGCAFYAENAERYLAPAHTQTEASYSGVVYQPLGVILAIMPWNFPLWQVFRFAAPAMMAGNVAVLKHASNVCGCALAIEELFSDFPPGCFSTLLVESGGVAEIIANPAIAAVTLTGSERAGSSVASEAGKAIKKTVLELGGSDPFVVLADANLDYTLEKAVQARIANAGQSCIAAKRFIVERQVYGEFVEGLAERFRGLKVGDPTASDTQVGPIAREDLVDALDKQVQGSVAAGARLVTGGKRIDRPGCYYEPTVLSDVRPGMPAFHEETFGPVAAVTPAQDVDEAITLANLTTFGLGASIWTGETRGRELAMRIEAGSVFVNEVVKSDPRLPFGGVKRSGYGRELSAEGIREFVNIKTIWVR